METKQGSNKLGSATRPNRVQGLKITTSVILFSLPLMYLSYKCSGWSHLQDKAGVTQRTRKVDIATLENAARIDPTFSNLMNLGVVYIKRQMPAKSLEPLKAAISLDPQSVAAHNNLAVAYIMLQQYQDAIDSSNRAIQINKTFELARTNLKRATEGKGKVLAAIRVQEQTPIDQRNAAFSLDYGLNYFKIGKYDKSIEIWSRIVDADKNNIQALNNIGTALMMKNQYEDSIRLYKTVLKLEPENQMAKNNLAWAIRQKEKQAALSVPEGAK